MTDTVVVTEQIQSVVVVNEQTIVVERAVEVVVVGIQGPQGPPGEDGSGGSGSENIEAMTTSTTLDVDDSHTVYINEGAIAPVVATLPKSAIGLKFSFINTDGDGFEVKATNGDILQIGNAQSSANGSFTSTKVGSAVSFYGASSGWYGTSSGVWTAA
jgi:hypothetical protein